MYHLCSLILFGGGLAAEMIRMLCVMARTVAEDGRDFRVVAIHSASFGVILP